METIIFTGLQASGKSTFYRENFFATHVRVSLDLLRTRHRESRLMNVCFETTQKLVVDNTNPTRADRSRYLVPSRKAGFRVIGYYFQSAVKQCLGRNALRKQRVPDVAILATSNKLEIPSIDEGFDQLWYVQITDNHFLIEEWKS